MKSNYVETGGMGVEIDMNTILESLLDQPPAIHDLKINFGCDTLYESLKNGTENMNAKNKGIFIRPLSWGNRSAKIAVYPRMVHIDLACTFLPYGYSYGGAIELTKTLENIRQHLTRLSNNKAQIPPIGSWHIVQYHFGRDGKESFSGLSVEHTWQEVEGGMMRFYSKHMPEGKIIPRLEQIRVPNRTLDQEIDIMVTNPGK